MYLYALTENQIDGQDIHKMCLFGTYILPLFYVDLYFFFENIQILYLHKGTQKYRNSTGASRNAGAVQFHCSISSFPSEL